MGFSDLTETAEQIAFQRNRLITKIISNIKENVNRGRDILAAGGAFKIGEHEKGNGFENFLKRPDLSVLIPTSLDVGEKIIQNNRSPQIYLGD